MKLSTASTRSRCALMEPKRVYLPRRGNPGRHAEETGLPGSGRGAPVEEVSPKITFYGRLRVIAYRATPDVSREVVWPVAKLLATERRRRGTPRGSRALSCFWQAVLGLRRF